MGNKIVVPLSRPGSSSTMVGGHQFSLVGDAGRGNLVSLDVAEDPVQVYRLRCPFSIYLFDSLCEYVLMIDDSC